MDRTIIVIGGFLALLGLAVAWNAYGFVQVERGWTLVISGTFAFCSGLVLVALGLVLRELEHISSSAAKAALLLAKTRGVSFEAPAAVEEAVAEKPAAAAPASAAPAPPAKLPPAPPFEPPPTIDFDEPELDLPIAPPKAPEPAKAAARPKLSFEPKDLPKDLPKQERAPLSWMMKPDRPTVPVAPVVPVAPPAPAPLSDDGAAKQLGSWLDRAISGEPEEIEDKPVADEPQPEPQAQPEPEAPEPPPLESTHLEQKPLEPTAQETRPAASAEVIGRYEAHGAHYVMYADGSIDAETTHGVYRFGSMEELKRFIEGEA